MSVNKFHLYEICAVLLTACASCGAPSDRAVVYGVVLYKDKPLQQGTIRFVPIDQSGAVTVAQIQDGTYATEKNRGLAYGRHRVEVTGYDLTGFSPAPGAQPEQIVPAEFNDESTITLEVDGESGNRSIDFNL